MTATAPPLGPELLAGLRRLKLATIRAQAPEVLQTARTQRWAPEEVLRTLVAAEIVARDEGNQRHDHVPGHPFQHRLPFSPKSSASGCSSGRGITELPRSPPQ